MLCTWTSPSSMSLTPPSFVHPVNAAQTFWLLLFEPFPVNFHISQSCCFWETPTCCHLLMVSSGSFVLYRTIPVLIYSNSIVEKINYWISSSSYFLIWKTFFLVSFQMHFQMLWLKVWYMEFSTQIFNQGRAAETNLTARHYKQMHHFRCASRRTCDMLRYTEPHSYFPKHKTKIHNFGTITISC